MKYKDAHIEDLMDLLEYYVEKSFVLLSEEGSYIQDIDMCDREIRLLRSELRFRCGS